MSIVKYTTKYILIGALAIVVCAGIGGLVYSKYQKNDLKRQLELKNQSVHGDVGVVQQSANNPLPPAIRYVRGASGNTTPSIEGLQNWCGAVPIQVEFREPFSNLPADLRKRLRNVYADGNSIDNNPNFFREVYDAVSNGQDMDTTIKLLKEYRIYTDVVLEHMDTYEAFKYVQEYAPTDQQGPAKKYGNRLISQNPQSAESLEAMLHIAVYMTDDPHEKETYLRGAIKYHPNSGKALYELGSLLSFDKPGEAVMHLKKGELYNPAAVNAKLGVAYERLGDYKTAWIHYKKALHHNPEAYCIINLEAIEKGEPVLSPIKLTPDENTFLKGSTEAQEMPERTSSDSSDVFVDLPDLPERDDPPSPVSDSKNPSPEDIARQEAERTFFESLREQQRLAEESYLKELEAFINWAESVINDTPIDPNNFLEKELERHLSNQKTTFDPDRITRGFEMIQKYGQTEGIKRLEKNDPKLAERVKQLLNKRQMRPRKKRDQ